MPIGAEPTRGTPGTFRGGPALMRALGLAGVALILELLAAAGLALLEDGGVRYRPIVGDRLSEENRWAIEELLTGRESPFALDEILGWTLEPGYRSPEVNVDAGGRRRDPERPAAAANAVRLAAFGDSFTFGGDVEDRHAYPEALARLDPGIEVANYGVPAYGLDQAYLRYLKERAAARAQVVVIGYLAENICRNVNVFRGFYQPGTTFALAKPRYLPGARDGLDLVANPLPTPESYRRLLANPAETLAELGRHDAFYRNLPHAATWDRSAAVRLLKLAAARLEPLGREDCYGSEEAFTVTTRLFRHFYETVHADGAQPIILIFPTREDLAARREKSRKSYAPLLKFFAGRGYRVVDLMEVFDGPGRNLTLDELVPSHMSPRGNALIAEHLSPKLRLMIGGN
jgi:hypothetical protein